ncbi:MAG: hypothetical protein K2X43_10635 [Hyphomonadaceae bacterium]|jgi:hypothetical protein|nr:hypothetical protein [Hyphomonadaceae bacterium]
MEPSVVGFLVLVGLMLVGALLGAPIIVGLLASLPFGSTAIATLSALGGSSPLVYSAFVALLIAFVSLRRDFVDQLAMILTDRWVPWLVGVLIVYSCASAVFLPRLFAGTTTAFVVTSVGFIQEVPLAPVSGNITQTAYFAFGALAYYAFAVLLIEKKNQELVRRGFLVFVTITAVLGLVDVAAKLSGLGDILLPIRTANYGLLIDVMEGGFWRITGAHAEASAYAGAALSCLAFSFAYWRTSRSLPVFMLMVVLLALVVFSTSSTAYGSLAVLVPIAAISVVLSGLQGRSSVQDITLVLIVWMSAIAALSIYLWNERFFDPLVQLFETMVLSKFATVSGIERSYWNAQSLQALYDTSGVGIGMGSSRSSSWIVSVFSQLGVLGGLLMMGLVGYLVWDMVARKPVHADVKFAALAAGARAAALASLVAGSIGGSSADPGILFFISLAVVESYRRPISMGAREPVGRVGRFSPQSA